MSTQRLPSKHSLISLAWCTWQSPCWHCVETAFSALCSQVLLRFSSLTFENLTTKCTLWSFNPSPPLFCCAWYHLKICIVTILRLFVVSFFRDTIIFFIFIINLSGRSYFWQFNPSSCLCVINLICLRICINPKCLDQVGRCGQVDREGITSEADPRPQTTNSLAINTIPNLLTLYWPGGSLLTAGCAAQHAQDDRSLSYRWTKSYIGDLFY